MASRMLFLSQKLINVQKDLTDISKMPIGDESGFGIVHKGKFHKRHHHREEIIDCAIKYIKPKISLEEDIPSVIQELKMQSYIKHDALLPLLGYYVPFGGIGKITIVTPLMVNGSLKQLLDKEAKSIAPLEWDNTKRMITIIGVASGLCRMHQENLIHRDIKPANILLDDDFHPKICDFGISKIFEEGLNEIRERTNCGTLPYEAPEMLQSEYNSKVDVYAYGLVLYEIFAQERFYDLCVKEKKTYLNAMLKQYRPDISEDMRFPPCFRSLITECWAHDPDDRPDFHHIVEYLLDAYEKGEIEKNSEIDDYILDNIEPLGFNVDFLKT